MITENKNEAKTNTTEALTKEILYPKDAATIPATRGPVV